MSQFVYVINLEVRHAEGHTDLPDDDVGVCRARHHEAIFAAGVETPHFVLVGVQRLHTLVGLYGPQLHQAIGTTAGSKRECLRQIVYKQYTTTWNIK